MLISDDVGQASHDRATRGSTLTPEEQAQLDTWYAAQDNAEKEHLRLAAQQTLPELQSQVTTALERSVALTKRLQELSDENDALRREISLLREQVTRNVCLHDGEYARRTDTEAK